MTEELSYIKIKTANEARLADEARVETLKRNIIVLILHHFQEHGYLDSCVALENESGVSLATHTVCDNVDLVSIVQEYDAYYKIKFGKAPKLIKKNSSDKGAKAGTAARHQSRRSRGGAGTKLSRKQSSSATLPRIRSPTSQRRSSSASRLDPDTVSQKGGTLDEPMHFPNRGRKNEISGPHGTAARHTRKSGESGRHGDTSSNRDIRAKEKLPNRGTEPNPTSQTSPPEATSRNMNLTGQSMMPHQQHLLSVSNSTSTAGKRGQSTLPSSPILIDMRKQLQGAISQATNEAISNYDHHDDKLLKPLGNFGAGYDGQMKELANVIGRDIYLRNPNIRWKDIIGLENACRLVKEAVVYPIKYPQLFRGILSPWKGLLLYGPPGTGKTMLAKAIATECRTTFFNISASSIVSKWRGDSEKLVRVLFELARFHAPSTIFLDELDSIMSVRSGSSDHEGSRRMKTELLMQMDGLNKSDDLVFVLGASNLPWELDPAMLRRLEKRILVDLPTLEAREAMFKHLLPEQVLSLDKDGITLTSDINYAVVSERTEGYSGSDIRLVCKEAAMRPVRQIFSLLDELEENSCETLASDKIRLNAISTDDVLSSIQSTKPSAAGLQDRYIEWQKQFESM